MIAFLDATCCLSHVQTVAGIGSSKGGHHQPRGRERFGSQLGPGPTPVLKYTRVRHRATCPVPSGLDKHVGSGRRCSWLVFFFFLLGCLIPSPLCASSWLVSSSDLGVARSNQGFRRRSSLPGVLLPPALPSAAPCCRDYCSLLTSQPGLDVSFRITGLFTAQVPIMLPQRLKRKRFAS